MNLDMASLFAARERERYALHSRYLNDQLVRVAKIIGYDIGFVSGQGQYLFDRAGTRYLDLVGGYTPETREADDEAARRCRIFVDRRESAFDVGDIQQPIASGAIRKEDVLGDLYDLIGGSAPGRLGPNDITLFKNVGGGHLDLMTARAVLSQLGAE